ncbi:tetratricopeptide repeat protein [Candidatus Accumulibacter contiguus]|jgi:hypothetical protein|uniref:tetratricopeptide repeat protein n=1 Tax=Candidatus Accumulibacter contiguus TaxID=2954381 RepID=UPI002FC3B16C
MRRKLVMVIAAIVLLIGGAIAVVSSTFDNAVMAMKGGHYETARPKLEWLATVGHARAQHLLGEMYAYGWGVTRDREEAVKWFRRAAYRAERLKDPAAYAAYYVGQNFSQGLVGVQQDSTEAAWWVLFAKDGGYSGDPR